MINWLRVLNSAGVEYVERGANVKRGEINIRCPFCGNADPSHHMGLSLTTGWWACWRNAAHRGKSPLRLLVKLLRCTYARACELAGITGDYVDPEGFDAVAARIMSRNDLDRVEEVRREFLHLPKDETRVIDARGSTRRHWEYMVNVRGFLPQDVPAFLDYAIVAGIGGAWQGRVILPYLVHNEIVAWTARAISADARLRYRDLEIESCLIPPKETLYNHDALVAGGSSLLVVEGPLDSLKLDMYGKDWGVRAVGLSTNSMTDAQIYLLEESAHRFKRVLVMMDNASTLGVIDSFKLKSRLQAIPNLGFVPVPFGKKDGAELTPRQVVHFARTIE